jgi:hypothetical protein
MHSLALVDPSGRGSALKDYRRRTLVSQLNEASSSIDRLLDESMRCGADDAVALHEASQAVHRALLALS